VRAGSSAHPSCGPEPYYRWMSGRSRAERYRLHVALMLGLALCALGFTVELHRGISGHFAAWAYVVEWPVFALVGAVTWWRLLHEPREAGSLPTDRSRVDAPEAVGGPEPATDPELQAWHDYVARLESREHER